MPAPSFSAQALGGGVYPEEGRGPEGGKEAQGKWPRERKQAAEADHLHTLSPPGSHFPQWERPLPLGLRSAGKALESVRPASSAGAQENGGQKSWLLPRNTPFSQPRPQGLWPGPWQQPPHQSPASYLAYPLPCPFNAVTLSSKRNQSLPASPAPVIHRMRPSFQGFSSPGTYVLSRSPEP